MILKAIETNYRGRRYRSRLEARWGMFFDILNIPFEYEIEGFELPSGRYLPDFWLPKHNYWIEIKGPEPTKLERQLASELAIASGNRVFIFSGQMKFPEHGEQFFEYKFSEYCFPEADVFFPEGGGDIHYQWCACGDCGAYDIQFDGRSNRMPCKETSCQLMEGHPDKGYNWSGGLIPLAAYRAATARFEFNERK